MRFRPCADVDGSWLTLLLGTSPDPTAIKEALTKRRAALREYVPVSVALAPRPKAAEADFRAKFRV